MGNDSEALQILERLGAITNNDHFVYTSGRHGSVYINKDAIYPHIKDIMTLGYLMADIICFRDVDVVLGPEKGGIILAQWVAYGLIKMTGREDICAIYAEREGDHFVIKRGYEKLIPGRNILIVEDILTTGGSIRKVVSAVEGLRGNIVALTAICNRGGVKVEDVGISSGFYSLINDLNLESWTEAECPLCARGVSVNTTIGKGRKFLAGRH